MNEIKLRVDDKHLETVMTLLKSLKEELVSDITLNGEKSITPHTQYQPRTNAIIREEESGTNDTSGKYVSANTYKQRLKSKK